MTNIRLVKRSDEFDGQSYWYEKPDGQMVRVAANRSLFQPCTIQIRDDGTETRLDYSGPTISIISLLQAMGYSL